MAYYLTLHRASAVMQTKARIAVLGSAPLLNAYGHYTELQLHRAYYSNDIMGPCIDWVVSTRE